MNDDPANILRLFRSGMDTCEIARKLHVTEGGVVSRDLWLARCEEKNLPALYLVKKTREVRRVDLSPLSKSA